MLSFLEVRGTDKELRAIRKKLLKIRNACAEGKGEAPEGAQGCRLTIAIFPGRPRSS